MENLVLHKREKGTGHGARRQRRKGVIPGVLYGKTINNFMFEIGEIELHKEVYKNGEHGILDVEIDGQKHKTLIKEVQRDPVKRKIMHIDLEELPENETIRAEVPIVFKGEDLVMKRGEAVQKEINTVRVQCKAEILPKFISVDISSLNAGETYRIADIELAEDISIIENANTLIALITKNNKPSDIPVED
ncbi:50S ribosomal protein L25 [Clostridium sp. DJ247]|uniref:50S ribosomal protein L25 n=1 Tax=Clostridium sp. DJ247 TaxID=2726188 RepID=UPI001624788B|nr:50S ribosomal protein L25 [Clostridium sp. DJ247]MBC2580256.1 50S ribosomal protein L25 [Clostridium sp. DJ247]